MSLDYTGANNGLFTHLGKYVKYFNQFSDEANDGTTGLDAVRKAILDALNAGAQFVAVQGLSSDFEGWKVSVADQRGTLMSYALKRLQDPASVLRQIDAATNDQNEILRCVFQQMLTDSQTIQESSVSIGSVSAGSGNIGDGKVFTTDILDGISSPGARSGITYPSMYDYAGLKTELALPSESMTLECTQADEAAEFSWKGEYPDPLGPYGLGPEGSGEIGTVREIHDTTESILTNPDFEDFTTANVPDGWDIVAGSAGTEIFENTNLADVSHGLKSLKYTATGGASIEISQSISASSLTGKQRYLVSAQILADSGISSGTFLIQFEGTGYTAGSTEKIEIASASLPTAFDTNAFFVTMPASIPSDFKLVIRWSGTPTSGKSVYIDDLGIAPVTYGGGIGLGIVRGPTLFGLGDRFTFSVSNTEGVFQQAFREMFGIQLPSSSSPTISDTLAQ
ncbi:hypothetical protein [Bremerella cremea]|nr:hypothetical protein [Bremerella cremea]